LRERVEVLERILTDRRDLSSSLAREIEALRDLTERPAAWRRCT
jgi:hypothetical protein